MKGHAAVQSPFRAMKPGLLFPLLFLATLGKEGPVFAGEHENSPASRPFAVVELFTSEGCSSCPPADDLLAEIAAEARQKGQRIFPLAFHVDYWNDLGWTDPFSDHAYSRRQHEYAQVFDPRRVYTPQMVVNGADAFVGSDRDRAHRSIRTALSRPSPVAVALKAAPVGSDTLAVTYEVSGAPTDAILNIALIERGLVTRVPRGENAGRTLRHENVVRVFRTLPVGSGTLRLPIPTAVVRQNSSLVGYVQNPQDMAVLGATETLREGVNP